MDESVVEEIVTRLSREDRFDWVGVYLVEGDELVLGPYRGAFPAGHDRIPMGEGVCGAVAESGRTEVVPDVSARGGHIQCFLMTNSEVVVPIARDGEVLGVLDIDSDTLDAFGEEQVRLVESAAAEIAARA
jgi:GAF domain-containing protein